MTGHSAAQEHERREVVFSGRVQGVGFRYSARSIATRFAVTGFVQNLQDGRVLLVVEAERQEIDNFLGALRTELGRFIRSEQTTTAPTTAAYIDFAIHH